MLIIITNIIGDQPSSITYSISISLSPTTLSTLHPLPNTPLHLPTVLLHSFSINGSTSLVVFLTIIILFLIRIVFVVALLNHVHLYQHSSIPIVIVIR